MKKNILLLVGFFFLIIETNAQTVTDIDGNIYTTMMLGTQIWIKENLKTTHFNNGDLIETTSMEIYNDSTSVYQWPYNEDSLNIPIYGRLYTWYVVHNNRNVCPVGWHVPSDTEWTDLANFLGGDSVAGNQMKETGTTHWSSTDSTVTNSSGFTALPGGFRGNPNGFNGINSIGDFWTSTLWGSNTFPRAYTFNLQSGSSKLNKSVALANCGLSLRCIKDAVTSAENLFPEDKIQVFPNPTTDKITIYLEGIRNLHATIYDVTGAIVFQTQLTNKTTLIDLTFLSQGVFIIKIIGEDCNITRKLIKE